MTRIWSSNPPPSPAKGDEAALRHAGWMFPLLHADLHHLLIAVAFWDALALAREAEAERS